MVATNTLCRYLYSLWA